MISHGPKAVVDEPGNSLASARAYTAGASGVIGTASDVDWYRITQCQAGATITAEPGHARDAARRRRRDDRLRRAEDVPRWRHERASHHPELRRSLVRGHRRC